MPTATWTQRTPTTHPPAVSNPAHRQIVYDSNRNRLFYASIVNTGVAVVMEFWYWESGQWTQLFPATTPDADNRIFFNLSFDPVRGKIIMFGGTNTAIDTFNSDIWEYDWNDWSLVSVATAPSPRVLSSMTYDWKNQRTIIFGGLVVVATVDTYHADTWAYDGIDCVDLGPSTSPSGRYYSAMAYDFKTEKIVLFGGTNATLHLADTWLLDLDTDEWSNASPATTPSPNVRYPIGQMHSRYKPLMIMQNNFNTDGPLNTFEWDGDTPNWVQFTNATTPIPYNGGSNGGSGYNSKEDYLLYLTSSIPQTTWTTPIPAAPPLPSRPKLSTVAGLPAVYHNGQWHVMPAMPI